MKKIFIMSAKFAPGHFSHLLAYYELFQANNCVPCLYLDENYKPFITNSKYNYYFINEENNIIPDILFIYNLSKIDYLIIKKFKKIKPNIKIYFVYHEPWQGYKKLFKNLFTKRESLHSTILTLGRYFFAKNVLKKSNKILLPSNEAYEQYLEKCTKYNKNIIIIPLIFTDECVSKIKINEKKYFSFISTVSTSKNFLHFINFIKYKAKIDKNAYFQIATRSNISNFIDEDLKILIQNGHLKLNYGHPLSNEEINEAYNNSYCTWLLYKKSTQSGVLCKSFMFGTPVIATNLESFKPYINKSGVLLEENADFSKIDLALKLIEQNLKLYSSNARKYFLNTFYWTTLIDNEDIKNLVK